jgi:hypothetical protein
MIVSSMIDHCVGQCREHRPVIPFAVSRSVVATTTPSVTVPSTDLW